MGLGIRKLYPYKNITVGVGSMNDGTSTSVYSDIDSLGEQNPHQTRDNRYWKFSHVALDQYKWLLFRLYEYELSPRLQVGCGLR
ncbi:uncharacterized protein [Rutidosis leptorrhynchoides]|uniref:uncharacterized protein isoform X3 n=1 Tax=Rutidosis leptorrhynchoides TaxID=125765 RepID=UPI003A997549